jgi:hypothetical protein
VKARILYTTTIERQKCTYQARNYRVLMKVVKFIGESILLYTSARCINLTYLIRHEAQGISFFQVNGLITVVD